MIKLLRDFIYAIRMMGCFRRSLFILMIIGSLKFVQPQCLPVQTETMHCQLDDKFKINCPASHNIDIQLTEYLRATSDSCPPDVGTGACLVTSDVDEIRQDCHKLTGSRSHTCSVDVRKRTGNRCAKNQNTLDYVRIIYQCIPQLSKSGNAAKTDLEDDQEQSGTMLYVHSHETALSGTFIHTSDYGCVVEVSPGTQAVLTMLYFNTAPDRKDCSQTVLAWDDEGIYEFCDILTSFTVPCRDTPRILYIKHTTDSDKSDILFVLQITAAYDSAGVKSQCNQPLAVFPVTPKTTTSTTTTTTTTVPTTISTKTPKVTSGDDNDNLPIILGVVAAAVVVFIILGLIIVHRYRNDRKPSKKDAPENKRRVIGTMYLDGESSADLTIANKFGMKGV